MRLRVLPELVGLYSESSSEDSELRSLYEWIGENLRSRTRLLVRLYTAKGGFYSLLIRK